LTSLKKINGPHVAPAWCIISGRMIEKKGQSLFWLASLLSIISVSFFLSLERYRKEKEIRTKKKNTRIRQLSIPSDDDD